MSTFPRYAATPTTANVTLTVVDTEYTYTIPEKTTKLKFQNRSNNTIRYAFVTAKVATPTAPYFTVKATGLYYEDNLKLYGKILYLAGTNAGDVVEIETWQV